MIAAHLRALALDLAWGFFAGSPFWISAIVYSALYA